MSSIVDHCTVVWLVHFVVASRELLLFVVMVMVMVRATSANLVKTYCCSWNHSQQDVSLKR
jgi:hypothetical protein